MRNIQEIIIIKEKLYYLNITFKKENLIFFNNKNIKFIKLFKKLDNKKYESFKINKIIEFFY